MGILNLLNVGTKNNNRMIAELNLDKQRNELNTETRTYNCGGYAMGTYQWLCLDGLSLLYSDYKKKKGDFFKRKSITGIPVFKGFNKVEELRDYKLGDYDEYEFSQTIVAVNDILNTFGKLARVVRNANEVKENEFPVLFRIAERDNPDFHFIKRNDLGNWVHKPGGTPIRPFNGDPYSDSWSESRDYCGPIITFAVNRKQY